MNKSALSYEDLIADPASAVELIDRTIDVPASAFEQQVLDKVMRGRVNASEPLGKNDIEALQHADLQDLAKRLGYQLQTWMPERSLFGFRHQ